MADKASLAETLKRTTVEVLPDPLDGNALAERLAAEPQALCIVNTKAHAAELFAKLRERAGTAEGVYHLSTNLCPAHRRDALATILKRLAEDQPCRVVSTQLIEAGVDIDFPVVYRSLAGIDAIAQAAGRCNREGRLATGPVTVFTPAERAFLGSGFIRQTGETAASVLRRHGHEPLSLSAITDYFQRLYHAKEHVLDGKNILGMAKSTREGFSAQFREIASAFQLIEDPGEPVVVPFGGEGRKLCDALTGHFPADVTLLRRAQAYTVNALPKTIQALKAQGAIVPATGREGLWVMVADTSYHAELGVSNSEISAEQLIR